VQELLSTDTAAILLYDKTTDELVALAARGIEEEVRQGVRIPLGMGFAGTIAAQRRPMVLDHVDETNVANPLLIEKGIESLLGVPMLSATSVIGVLHVGTLSPRRFDEHDAELLQLVADRAALAIEARRSNLARAAAGELQRSLIPSRLPAFAGFELAARYMPGEAGGVGGDWYDVFSVPDGRLAVVMGDVVGRGLGAAVVMGRVRSALRAYAIDRIDPGRVLTALDRKLHHFEIGQMATVVYGVVDGESGLVELSVAGHPLPIVATADGSTSTADAVVDPPLGVIADWERATSSITLDPGSLLMLYTDGLVERRHTSFDEGIERLCEVIDPSSAQLTCTKAVRALIGGVIHDDDVAMLALRRTPQAASTGRSASGA
jgi:serine phosphatase RsbU (regulator of sigma subunit)